MSLTKPLKISSSIDNYYHSFNSLMEEANAYCPKEAYDYWYNVKLKKMLNNLYKKVGAQTIVSVMAWFTPFKTDYKAPFKEVVESLVGRAQRFNIRAYQKTIYINIWSNTQNAPFRIILRAK